MELIYEDIETPLGTFRVAERAGRVCAASFTDGWHDVATRMEARFGAVAWTRGTAAAAGAIRSYFDGDVAALEPVQVEAEGSTFQRSVWERLRRIEPGTTMSYSGLADSIGAPRASRAVGTANAANPVCLIVPCHRVVRADGAAGGYAGGPHRKSWLLEHEASHTTR